MTAAARTILHLDMDAFYAAVEQRDRPELRGRPVLVGGAGRRGVVTTASYEARVFGCRSAMPTARALRLCPEAIVVRPRFEVYAAVSRQVRAILERYTPDIEPVSIDEAYADLSGVPAWRADPIEAGRRIKAEVRSVTGLTASVGIAPNKFLAKVASDLDKPDGLRVIGADEAAEVLAPLPATVLWGVGKVAGARLEAMGVRTVADLVGADRGLLEQALGREAVAGWLEMARGRDGRTVQTGRVNKSIGKERTFGEDVSDPAVLRAVLLDEVEQAARSLREDGLRCGTVVVKLRRPDFTTLTRSKTLAGPTDSTVELWEAASGLLEAFLDGRRIPLRLLGVSLQGLTGEAQMDLFTQVEENARRRRVDAATDAIAAKFGAGAIHRAGALGRSVRRREGGGAGSGPGTDRRS